MENEMVLFETEDHEIANISYASEDVFAEPIEENIEYDPESKANKCISLFIQDSDTGAEN